MDRITGITKDCFNAIAQVREAEEGSLPAPSDLHARLRACVDELLRRAAAEGLGREEANELAYPIVALADEVVLSRSSEELRAFWGTQPLQLHYFQENVAGERFFARLDVVRRDPRRAPALRAYYLALLFGFQGRYRMRGGDLELMGIVDGLSRELSRARAHDIELLSPSGERPAGQAGRGPRAGAVLWIAAAALVLSAIVYAGLRVSLAASTAAVVERIAASATL